MVRWLPSRPSSASNCPTSWTRRALEWRDVPWILFGYEWSPENVPYRFMKSHDYAVRKGFVGGFPNFHQANASAGYVYGTILLPAETAQWVGIPLAEGPWPE